MDKDCPVQPSSVICLSICRTVCTSVSPYESEVTYLYLLSLPYEKGKVITSVCRSYGKRLHAAVSTYTSYSGRCTSCTVLLDWHLAVCLHHTKKIGGNYVMSLFSQFDRKSQQTSRDNLAISVAMCSRMQWCKVVQSQVNKYKVKKTHKIN